MKRTLIIASIIFIFGLGFLIGQHSNIRRILAQELMPLTPTASPVPTILPTSGPTEVPSYQPLPIPTSGGGPRNDIVEIQHITADKSAVQVGEDIGFTVTIKNQSAGKKNIKQLCFNSTDGNFGCTMDFNLYPGQSFNFNNSGRFTSGGTKTIWVTWTQDGQNFYRPLNSGTVNITIQN